MRCSECVSHSVESFAVRHDVKVWIEVEFVNEHLEHTSMRMGAQKHLLSYKPSGGRSQEFFEVVYIVGAIFISDDSLEITFATKKNISKAAEM